MTRRSLALAAACFGLAFAAIAVEPPALDSTLCVTPVQEEALPLPLGLEAPQERLSCTEQCIAAYYACPVQCGASWQDCYDAHQICLGSAAVPGCTEPWLPC